MKTPALTANHAHGMPAHPTQSETAALAYTAVSPCRTQHYALLEAGAQKTQCHATITYQKHKPIHS